MARAHRAMTAVAFDARETSHMSAGVLNYSRKLREWLPRVASDVRLIPVGRGDNFDFAEQVGLPLALLRSGARLAHFPTLFVPRFVPLPYVVTVHDLIDLNYRQYVKRRVLPYLRAVVAPVVRAARVVITDDEATVGDLERLLGVDPKCVRVIALGCDDPPAAVAALERAHPYLLYVGNRRPHKNLATLVAAWAALPAAPQVDLVLSGAPDEDVRAQRGPGELVFLGDCTDAELRRWYAGAAAYVHPALREGFGLPLLEAMRNGARVVATRAAVPRLLAAHAVLVDPAESVAAWREALSAVLGDPGGARLAASAAREATRDLTWERTARLTAAVYREIAE
jgi:glycosyltransferase involved in cell wall biosynthesis